MTPLELSARFFLQLACILGACRLVGLLARRIGQPQVVAEMITGVLLGPSFLGWLLPGLHGRFFIRETMPILYAVSQVGLVLYMFCVGLGFNVDLVTRQARSAASVSVAGIVVPFTLGALLAGVLLPAGGYFSSEIRPLEAMLFLGASMSITAFPMLARIIYEQGIVGTKLGTLALAAGSLDDAAAWCVLAVVLATFSGDARIAVMAIGGGAFYAVGILTIGRKMLAKLGIVAGRRRGVPDSMFSFVLLLVMLAAWFTDVIGIHSVFGAFLLGVALPRGIVTDELQKRIQPLTTHLLLPLFFVYSGLNTRISLVDSPFLWFITALIFLAACVGKGVACWAAALLNGATQRDAMSVGILMNARGLMELIILNIGLERGIITSTLFTMMVMMAVATTLLASPLFTWVYRGPRHPLGNGLTAT